MVNFIGNTAVNDGAAIYANDIAMCIFAPGLSITNDTQNTGEFIYNRTIFQTCNSPFSFWYINSFSTIHWLALICSSFIGTIQ